MPILHFRPGVVKALEPVGVQALSPELAIKALDTDVVGRLSGAREVESDAFWKGLQIKIAADKFAALVNADRFSLG